METSDGTKHFFCKKLRCGRLFKLTCTYIKRKQAVPLCQILRCWITFSKAQEKSIGMYGLILYSVFKGYFTIHVMGRPFKTWIILPPPSFLDPSLPHVGLFFTVISKVLFNFWPIPPVTDDVLNGRPLTWILFLMLFWVEFAGSSWGSGWEFLGVSW